ncbi:glycine--tRNA ligase subunit beta [bacterium]|nr:MAG: glycine--tRNA ligase subunit beta [bacterium]
MNSNELILEIGTEEMPAGFVPKALASFEELLRKKLESARLGFTNIKTLGTPRRLAFIIEGLPERQPDASIEVRGPQKKAAFDETGAPTKTLEGFLKAQGAKLESVKTVISGKAEYVSVTKEITGLPSAKILGDILSDLIKTEVFAKSMRWGAFDMTFARPVHWILCVFAGKPLDVAFGHIKSAALTYGHKFLSTGPITVTSARDYIDGLSSAFVVPDPDERKAIIKRALESSAKDAGGVLMPDDGLIDEVAFLVEYPVVIRGSFDQEFLTLPRGVIINAMREHQRYFSIIGNDGTLLPYFLTVANTKATDPEVVKKGNERVLRARLNDAKFYFEKDIKTPLVKRAEALKGVVFQAKLGTSFEKAERFTELANYIGSNAGLCGKWSDTERASDFLTQSLNPSEFDREKVDPAFYSKLVLGRSAMLSKADLTSGMVGEFPKLQGIMGNVYAKRDKEADEVCVAICEHYLPNVSGGTLPVSVYGAVVSMADKLDTIAGCFGVGLIPTGAQDPYGLRRQALGILAMIRDKNFTFDLDEAITKAVSLIGKKLLHDKDKVKNDVLEFFKERLKNQLLSEGLSFDSIDAVLSTQGWASNIPDAIKRINALEAFKKHPDCQRLSIAFKRVSNILKGAGDIQPKPDASVFSDQLEKALYAASLKTEPLIRAFCEQGEYLKVFIALASIKEEIDAFFDKVMVMTEDEKVRANRLALLNFVRLLYFQIADLSKLSTPST